MKKIVISYSGPHKPQMIKLQGWLDANLPDIRTYLSSQNGLARLIRKVKPDVVITYHKNLYKKKNLNRVIEFCEKGGTLVVLHHNLSSMMLKRPKWQEFCEVKIERGEQAEFPWSVSEGGDLYYYNLQEDHPITTRNVDYGAKGPSLEDARQKFGFEGMKNNPSERVLTYELSPEQIQEISTLKTTPAIVFPKSEYFINHVPLPNPNRTLLFGMYYYDSKTGRAFMSMNGGWMLPKKQGMLYYLMPGHSKADYHEPYCNIIKNIIEA